MKKDQIKANVEKLIYNLKRHSDAQLNDEIKAELNFMVKKFSEDASSICSERVNQSLHNTLYKLSKNRNIRVCKYDKGNGIAVMNTEDYYGKRDEIVNYKSKFVEFKEEAGIKAIIQKETSVTYYIKKYIK